MHVTNCSNLGNAKLVENNIGKILAWPFGNDLPIRQI